MSILERVLFHADKNPDNTAVIYNKKIFSYKQLALDIQASLVSLKRKDQKKNNKIILRASNTYEFICIYFSIHLLGATAVIIPAEKDNTFEAKIAQTTDSSLKIDNPSIFFKENNPKKCLTTIDLQIDPDDLADIIFSSGTTGNPKGVPITHGSQCKATKNIIKHVKNTSKDTELILMPLGHSFGMGRLRSILFSGGSLVIGPEIYNLKQIFHCLKNYKINGMGLVPSAWNLVYKLSKGAITKFSNQMKYIEFGSAYMTRKEKEFIMKSFPETNLVMHYGLTEVSRALFINFYKDDLEGIGRLQRDVSVKIINSDGKILPEGETGEIIIKSPWMSKEYYNNDELNKHSFYNEHIKTGDQGKISNGYLFLTGRLKEIINVGGRKVNPNYIEEKLSDINFIHESACIGIPHNEMGESIVAFLVIKKKMDISKEDIKKQINSLISEKVPAYMIPKNIIFIDEMPKTSSGKIKKNELNLLVKDGT